MTELLGLAIADEQNKCLTRGYVWVRGESVGTDDEPKYNWERVLMDRAEMNRYFEQKAGL